MVIKASAASEIRQLIEGLGGQDEVRREAAIARLAVIGARAVDRLIAAYNGTSARDVKIAVLRALEFSGDGRTVTIGRQAIAEGGDVAIAGVAALRALLDASQRGIAAEVLDVVVATALDPSVERRVRLAAFEALRDIPDVGVRVGAALQTDPDPALSAAAHALPREAAAADAVWQDALEGRLPDEPAMLREVAQTKVQAAPLSAVQRIIDAVRAQEGSMEPGPRREEWRAARGALHQALALRGSRVAVYDLRETLEESREPVPASFLAALHVVGDDTCLEALAAAYSHAPAGDARWRHQLGAAFRAIARREKVTSRHAAMKRIVSRWPEAARNLNTPSRTTPRLSKADRT